MSYSYYIPDYVVIQNLPARQKGLFSVNIDDFEVGVGYNGVFIVSGTQGINRIYVPVYRDIPLDDAGSDDETSGKEGYSVRDTTIQELYKIIEIFKKDYMRGHGLFSK